MVTGVGLRGPLVISAAIIASLSGAPATLAQEVEPTATVPMIPDAPAPSTAASPAPTAFTAAAPVAAYQPASQEAPALRSQQDLQTLVGPIALYPDALLSQVLAASTYPLDIVRAARWVKSHPDLEGLDDQDWDPSVRAVARYPAVLEQLDGSLDWTTALGQAFMTQQQDVMAAVQSLRQRAQSSGTLATTEQQQVIVQPESIQIVPANPEVIYVPTYDPQVVYTQTYYAGPPLLTFGVGYACGSWFNLDCNWRSRSLCYRPQSWWRPGFHSGPGPVDNHAWHDGPRGDYGTGQAWRRDQARPWGRPGGAAFAGPRTGHNAGPSDHAGTVALAPTGDGRQHAGSPRYQNFAAPNMPSSRDRRGGGFGSTGAAIAPSALPANPAPAVPRSVHPRAVSPTHAPVAATGLPSAPKSVQAPVAANPSPVHPKAAAPLRTGTPPAAPVIASASPPPPRANPPIAAAPSPARPAMPANRGPSPAYEAAYGRMPASAPRPASGAATHPKR